MQRLVLSLSLSLLSFALAGCAGTAPAERALSGRWAPSDAKMGGRDYPVAQFGGATLLLTADTYELGNDQGAYTVDAAGKPAKMDIRGRVGPNAGRTILAIYELAGDQLTVCYQLGVGDRPTEFGSPAGSRVLLVHYRRVA